MHDEIVDDFTDPKEIDADLVAISALTPNIVRAYYLADKLRDRGIKVICGGAHVSALPDEALNHFDTIVKGEAEPVWEQLIGDFESGCLQSIYDGGMASPLNDIKLPRRDLIHPNYHYPTINTSRGCPFSCDYCYLSIFKKKKYRVLPVDAIIEDMERVSKTGAPIAVIGDENIMGFSSRDIENRMELFEKMILRKIKFVWGAQATIEIYKRPELLKLMHKAGCRALFIGLEATEDTDLGQEVNKGFATGIDYKFAIKEIHKQNIAVIGSFILGMDSHNMKYAKKLPKQMKRLGIDYPRLFYLTAWPGTPLYHRLENENRITDGWSHVRKDIPSIKYEQFTEKEIKESERFIYQNIFTKLYILKILVRWLFRKPSMAKLFLEILKLNITDDVHHKKKKQLEKEKHVQRLLEEHFEGKKLVNKENLYKEMGGNYR